MGNLPAYSVVFIGSTKIWNWTSVAQLSSNFLQFLPLLPPSSVPTPTNPMGFNPSLSQPFTFRDTFKSQPLDLPEPLRTITGTARPTSVKSSRPFPWCDFWLPFLNKVVICVELLEIFCASNWIIEFLICDNAHWCNQLLFLAFVFMLTAF